MWLPTSGPPRAALCVIIVIVRLGRTTLEAPLATMEAPVPAVTDRATWQVRLDEIVVVREKAHTREGDAIAPARRLPMVEVNASTPVIRRAGPGPADRCLRGPQAVGGRLPLHARDVTYATFMEGPYQEGAAYRRRFMGYKMPWYSA